MDLVDLVKSIINTVVLVAWLVFLLSWVVGWLIKSLPIPFPRVKKWGARFVEDALWGAFWLAVSTTVFALIAYIASSIQQPLPTPPTI